MENGFFFLLGLIAGVILICIPKGTVCVKGEKSGVLVVDYDGKAYRLVEIQK